MGVGVSRSSAVQYNTVVPQQQVTITPLVCIHAMLIKNSNNAATAIATVTGTQTCAKQLMHKVSALFNVHTNDIFKVLSTSSQHHLSRHWMRLYKRLCCVVQRPAFPPAAAVVNNTSTSGIHGKPMLSISSCRSSCCVTVTVAANR